MSAVDLVGLRSVAAQLDRLGIYYAFTGGVVVGFLLDHPEVVNLRPTDDLDAITAVTGYGQQTEMEAMLRDLDFTHDLSEGAPICRFLYEGIKVDVMPVRDQTGRFDSPWFEQALASSGNRTLEGVTVRTVDAPGFVATKLAAFDDRSGGDMYSHDLEDIITVVDGRNSLLVELQEADSKLRRFVSGRVEQLMVDEDFRDALPGHLLPDTASQARLPALLKKLEAIAML